MATNFPTGLDAFTNPGPTDLLSSAGVSHSDQHADANDAIEALEAKVGVDSSAVTTSHEYRISALEGGGGGSSSLTLTDTSESSDAGPIIDLVRDSASPSDGDYLGQIKFTGKSDNGSDEIYAKMTGKISDVTTGTEDGLIEYAVKQAGSFNIILRMKGNELLTLNGCGITSDGDIDTNGLIRENGVPVAQVTANEETASYTLVLSDKSKMIEMNVASANTLTVPPNSSVAFPVGTQIAVLQTGAGQTTLTAGSGVTINSKDGNLKITGQWSAATLVKRATDTWVAIGDLSA